MKKKLICLGVLLLTLTACGQKKHGKTDSSSVQKSNSAKIESFNKENRNLLEKAEEQQVFTKHFVLPTDEKGIRQEQTITYQGEQLQKLVMTNTTPASDELKNAIQEEEQIECIYKLQPVREEYRALEEKILRVQKNIDDLNKKLDSQWTYEIYGTISKDEMLNTYNQTMKK